MQLFERDDALEALAGQREAAANGRGGVALVQGPVAVGKSALLDVFAGQAAQAGALVLSAVAAQAESTLRLGVLSQFAHCAAMPAADRALIRDLMAEAVRAPQTGTAGTSERQTDDARVTDRLCGHLIELSVRVPLAIVVDDVQYADPASLAGLGFLVRRVRDARIILVLGSGDHASPACRDFLMDVERQPFAHSITLQPLGRAGVTAMLGERLGQERAAHAADAAMTVTGGNPLLVGGLLEDAGAGPEQVLSVGEGYRRAVLAALRRGGRCAWAAAEAIAVGGGADYARRLLGPDGSVALTSLGRSGLVDGARLRHPEAAAAVLGAADPARCSDLHARAAELAEGEGRSAAEVAAHLLAAGRAPAPWAVDALAEAARLALADKRVGTAIDYLRLAVSECCDERRGARLETALVRAEWRRNPAQPVPRLAGLVEAMRAGHLVGADAAVLVRTLLWHGGEAEAREVLALLGRSPWPTDSESAAELRVTGQYVRFMHPPMLEFLPHQGGGRLEPAVGAAARAGRRLDAAVVLGSVVAHRPSEALADEAERILRTSGLDGMGMGGVELALMALIYSDLPHRAAQWCDKLIPEAAAREASARRARLIGIRGEAALRAGELPMAEECARSALQALSAAGWGVGIGSVLSTRLTALAAMGRLSEAAEVLTRPVPEAMLRTTFGLAYLRARGRVRLAQSDRDGALADFQACADLAQAWKLDSPGMSRWRTDSAEAWLALGQPDRARPLLEAELSRCDRRVRARSHGTALRLMARCSEPRERHVLLGQAVDILSGTGDRHALALALTDLTLALTDMGYTFRATITGRRAMDIAVECRAEPLFEALAPYCGPPEPAADLSEAEQRVAELAVQGLTNRQIAKRLYITMSTVEQHLTKVYRKLGVANRADLAAAQAAQVLGA
jgi:DNA-binding CsgD family transcriptional regulator